MKKLKGKKIQNNNKKGKQKIAEKEK